MEFDKSYNRQEFVNFLQHSFLPEDFIPAEEEVEFSTKMNYSTHAVRLGSSEKLDLVVYEVRHTSKHDARVALSKEAFRMLADENNHRALVAFVPEDNSDNYRFSFIEITLDMDEDSSRIKYKYSNPHRYSYYLGKGIAYHTPNKYLNEKGRVVDDEDLHMRFSVEVLTKEFYQELSDWYALAIKNMRFPNDINDKNDDDKFNNEGAIRLITRLIFVWFLKQRHLIPEEFFDEKYIADNLLKDFNPNLSGGLFNYKRTDSKYYQGILQNLFFAMLNSPITPEGSDAITERHFRNPKGDYDNNKLMRYESYFKNPQLFVDLANSTVPFLNGGLFDCLDDKDKGLYYDGFSDREIIRKSLIVPDYLFFGEEAGKCIDLSEWYADKKKKKVSARGIIDILKRYNFTVEENTPFDKEVSLDPELLGKVFENLLALFNPETQTTARKQTGSFYTPREIVQYMVDESLVAHLKRTVGDDLEPKFRQLLQYTDEDVELTDGQRKEIMQSLYDCKILDPACGSGAFPMGMLQQMVHILNRVDKDNSTWKEMMMKKALDETSDAYRYASDDERRELVNDIERSFDENINRPDYSRKLYLIENCIHGVDIQPIAIQISKLRFFISLVVDQNTNDNPADNFGIRPLPNLEAKFVAANTLIGLEKKDSTLFDSDEIKAKENELKVAKHKIFSAKTVRTKRKYRQMVNDLRIDIANTLKEKGAVGNYEAQQLASWDMFDQNMSSPFFDPDWMFGVKDGFNIVIGNPPYISAVTMDRTDDEKRTYKAIYPEARGAYDMYILFLLLGVRLSSNVYTWIIPNKFLVADYAVKTLEKLKDKCGLEKSIDVSIYNVFKTANVYPIIIIGNKSNKNGFKEYYLNSYEDLSLNRILEKNKIKNLSRTTLKEMGLLICSGATGFEAQKIKENVSSIKTSKSIPFTVSGNIDRYIYNNENVRYMKDKYTFAYVDLNDNIAKSKKNIWNGKKIIIAGMTKCIEACFVDSPLGIGVGTYAIYDFAEYDPFYILGVLNSKITTYFLRKDFSDKHLAGGYLAINKSTIQKFSFPLNENFKIKEKIANLAKQIHFIKQHNSQQDTSLFENEIDLLLYRLYGLTFDEILMIDPETNISRDIYESNI